MNSALSRLPDEFLPHAICEKAGIIGVRAGSSAPQNYPQICAQNCGPSFVWPSSPAINDLEYDSRKIKPGALYFALSGLHTDGHDYINDAIDRGAVAVVHQKELNEFREGVLYILVKDSRLAMSPIADAFYGFPSRRMGIIGVTGTEGKSTTVYLIYQLLKLSGKKAGFISTVQQGNGLEEKWNSEHQTTPEAVTIHRLLAEMYGNGAEYAVLESSSHGLSKKTGRLADVDFDIGVMTNVTHEHLEFHGTWENYRNDKTELFRALDSSPSSHFKLGQSGLSSVPSFGVANADDPSAAYFSGETRHKTYTFSTRGADADLSLRLIESGAGGNWYDVFELSTESTVTLRDQLPGAFNPGNVLAALLTVSNLLSVSLETLAPLVPYLKPVRGRMTAINRGQPFQVLVDYAHTPSSFSTIFPPLREQQNSAGGKLISLFGSPGERDTQKRALQGEIAASYSDIVILTDEDPRGEEPMAILEEIAKGCETTHGHKATADREAGTGLVRNETLFLIPDRPAALRKAFSLAGKGDLVLLLGKGHENSIIYASGAVAYDEIAEAEKALEEAGYHAKD